jgi:hypothetical protein
MYNIRKFNFVSLREMLSNSCRSNIACFIDHHIKRLLTGSGAYHTMNGKLTSRFWCTIFGSFMMDIDPKT